MRVLSKIAPAAAWTVLLVGVLAVAGPVATGDFDPEWLRVARMPVADLSGKSLLQLPEVPARFTAEGPLGTDGVWALTGEQVIARDPPFDHDLVAPRLVVRRAGVLVGELSAARGRIRIPRGEDDSAVLLDLEGAVELLHGDVAASTSAASIWLHKRNRFDRTSGGVRLSTPGPVVVRLGAQRVTAAGFDATLVPLRAELRGPIALDVDASAVAPVDSGAALVARPMRGRALAARLVGSLAPDQTPRDMGTAFPSRLVLTLEGVALEAVAPDEDALTCARLRATFVKNPAAARAALGGLGGAPPGPEVQAGSASYALDEVTAEGAVRARHGVGARRVTIEADVVSGRASTGRAVARGRPARLSTDGGWLEAPELTLARSGDVRAGGGQPIARVEARGAPGSAPGSAPEVVRFAFTPPPLRGAVEGPPAPKPWVGNARSVVARVRLSTRAEPEDAAPGPLERLERLDAEGPLTLAREDGSSRVDAQRLAWDATGRRTRIELEGEPVLAHLGADVTGEAPWRARARSVRVWLEPEVLAARDDAPRDDARADASDERASDGAAQAVASAVIEGDVELARQGADGPRRHIALAGRRLVWSRHRERAELTGPAAAVTVGESTLRASALTFDVARGHLQAAGPCVLEVPVAARTAGEQPAKLSIEAARAEASIDPRPLAWREAGEARRTARRAGARLVLPGWLHALTLEGDGARRVRASGPDGLTAECDRLTWDAARGWVRLEAAAGATVRASTKGLALDAARLELRPSRAPGRARALVLARGGARLRGSLPGGTEPATLTSEWLSAEVWEPVRTSPRDPSSRKPEDAKAPFGRVLAGGPDGIAIDGALADTTPGATAPIPVRMRAARLEADGTSETLRLDGWPDRPLVLARGDVQLEAPTARLALEDRRGALRVALDGPWTCTLPAVEGEAGRATCKGPLELVLDVARARTAGDTDTHDPTALARLLRSFDARGGLDVTTRGLHARADGATLGRPGELVLHGDPVEVTRGGMRSRGREQVLRLEELRGQ